MKEPIVTFIHSDEEPFHRGRPGFVPIERFFSVQIIERLLHFLCD